MIYHLLYLSEQSSLYEEGIDLKRILEISRKHNPEEGLTGVLIKNDKFFIQLLEGDRKRVRRLYQKLLKDKRHKNAKVLMEFEDKKPIFPNWSMGYVDAATAKDVNIRKLIPLIHSETMTMNSSKEKAITILKNFNQL